LAYNATDGNIYVADTFNHTIRQVTPGGSVSTFAGTAGATGVIGGTGATARFDQPTGIVALSDGTLVVTDVQNHIIRRITTAQVVTKLAGVPGSAGITEGGADTAQFVSPQGITMSGTSTLLVADTWNHAVRSIVTASGLTGTLLGTTGYGGSTESPTAKFSYPEAIICDAASNCYVADTGNHTLRFFDSSAQTSTVIGKVSEQGIRLGAAPNARLSAPHGLALTSRGALVITSENAVLVYAP